MVQPSVAIHGGAGRALSSGRREQAVRTALDQILDELWEAALAGAQAVEIARRGCAALEDCEHFNAGLGSAIQSDGQIRMSASLMDGQRRSFSGVLNVERVQNPIDMAAHLQGERDRVIDGRGAELLARELRLPLFDAVVDRRFSEWQKEMKRDRVSDQAQVSPSEVVDDSRGMGTVGVVVRDSQGQLAASTSTGGRGFERVGRVSDSATVAGNYATDRAAVSCTGIGEDITDEALAARVVVMCEGGVAVDEAINLCMDQAQHRDRQLAAIAVDATGAMSWGKTTELLLAVSRDPAGQMWAF